MAARVSASSAIRVRRARELGSPHTNGPADVEPGLFTAWHADETNPRAGSSPCAGVKFHDGSDFNADAVIWNLRRVYDDKSPQYDAPAAPIVRARVDARRFEKADDKTIVLTTKLSVQLSALLLPRC